MDSIRHGSWHHSVLLVSSRYTGWCHLSPQYVSPRAWAIWYQAWAIWYHQGGRWHQIDGEDKQNLLWEWNPTLPHPQTLHSESSRWGPTKRYCGCRTNKGELEKIFVTFHGFLGSGRVATVTTAAIQASWRIPTFCVMSPLNQMPLMHLQMFEIFEEKYLKYSTSQGQIKLDAFASSRFFL